MLAVLADSDRFVRSAASLDEFVPGLDDGTRESPLEAVPERTATLEIAPG